VQVAVAGLKQQELVPSSGAGRRYRDERLAADRCDAKRVDPWERERQVVPQSKARKPELVDCDTARRRACDPEIGLR
jgi:hypothetical protein